MQMLIFPCSLAGETSVEEEGYNGFHGLEVKYRPNPSLNYDFLNLGSK